LHPTERQLLDELGSLDPAVSQADTAEAWIVLIEQAGHLVSVPPAAGEWSATEVLAHLIVVEMTNGLRYRAMLVEESPKLADFDLGGWSSVLRAPGIQSLALLAMFRALRCDNLNFWGHLDAAERARIGVHADYGPESLELRFKMLAGHDRMHLGQARRAVALARANRAAG
jgi:hypothetical protein